VYEITPWGRDTKITACGFVRCVSGCTQNTSFVNQSCSSTCR